MRRAQVDDASDTRPFHVDAKGWGGQTTLSTPRLSISAMRPLLAAFKCERGRGLIKPHPDSM